jgi:hypothetical protein
MLTLTLLLLHLVLSGAEEQQQADQLEVGFLFPGTPIDFTWNYEHDYGARKLREVFRSSIRVTVCTATPPSFLERFV